MKFATYLPTSPPGSVIVANRTSPGFPAFSEQGTGISASHTQLPKDTRLPVLDFDQQY